MVLVLLQIPFYFIKVGSPFNNNAHGTLEDLPDAFVQIANNYQLLIAVLGIHKCTECKFIEEVVCLIFIFFLGMIVSIAFFNFAGISVTKELSATTRMVLDSVRTVVIWVVALAVKWQLFYWPQVYCLTISKFNFLLIFTLILYFE